MVVREQERVKQSKVIYCNNPKEIPPLSAPCLLLRFSATVIYMIDRRDEFPEPIAEEMP